MLDVMDTVLKWGINIVKVKIINCLHKDQLKYTWRTQMPKKKIKEWLKLKKKIKKQL